MPRARPTKLIRTLRELYKSDTPVGHRFRYGLLAFDGVTLLFIVATSFLPRTDLVEWLDVLFGLAHPGRHRRRGSRGQPLLACRDLAHPRHVGRSGRSSCRSWRRWSAKAPASCGCCARCACCTTYQLLAPSTWRQLLVPLLRGRIMAVVHLAVFVFIMTGFVYETQHPAIRRSRTMRTRSTSPSRRDDDRLRRHHPDRHRRPPDSVVVMILGVTLSSIWRARYSPRQGPLSLSACGLLRHDPDAVTARRAGSSSTFRMTAPTLSFDRVRGRRDEPVGTACGRPEPISGTMHAERPFRFFAGRQGPHRAGIRSYSAFACFTASAKRESWGLVGRSI